MKKYVNKNVYQAVFCKLPLKNLFLVINYQKDTKIYKKVCK